MCKRDQRVNSLEALGQQTTSPQCINNLVQHTADVTWRDTAPASPDTAFAVDSSTKGSSRSPMDLEIDPEEYRQSEIQSKNLDMASCQQLSMAKGVLAAIQPRRVPPCLRIPSAPATLQHTVNLNVVSSYSYCLDCSPDVQRIGPSNEPCSKPSVARRCASASLQYEPCWAPELDVVPLTLVHSTPEPFSACQHPAAFDSDTKSSAADAHLPPAFQLLATADAAVIIGRTEHTWTNRPPSGCWADGRLSCSSAPSLCSGSECSVTRNKLLVVAQGMPASMQRPHWSLSDFWISKRLYKGYASSVYHVR